MDIKQAVKQIDQKSNPAQRAVIGLSVPPVILLLGWGIMSIIDRNSYRYKGWGWHFDPTELNESWWGWLLIIVAIGTFEYVWLRGKPRND